MPCLIHRPLASMLPPRPPLSTLFPYTTLFRSRLGHEQSLAHEPFPVADPELLVEDTVTCVVQVAGKLRDKLEVPVSVDAEELERLALESPAVTRALGDRGVRKVIVKAPRLVNVVPA